MNPNQRPNRQHSAALLALAATSALYAIAQLAPAADKYWDTGTGTGLQGTTTNTQWLTANWATDAAGGGQGASFAAGDNAFFQTTGTTTYTVQNNGGAGGLVIGALTVDKGNAVVLASTGSSSVWNFNPGGGIVVTGASSLQFNTINTPQTNVTPGSPALTIGAGSTFVLNQNATSNPKLFTLGAVSFTGGGENTFRLQRSTAFDMTVTAASLAARPGGTVANFVVDAGTNTRKLAFTAAPAPGFIDAGYFYNGGSYAAYDAAAGVRALAYGTDSGTVAVGASFATFVDAGATGAHVDLGTAGAITAATDATVNTLRLGSTNGVTLAAEATLTLANGGLLKAGGGAAAIAGGAGLTTSGAAELVIRTDAADDVLTLNTPILASSTGGLTKSGPGTLVLGTANGFAGPVSLLAGTLQVNTPAGLPGAGLTVAVPAGATLAAGFPIDQAFLGRVAAPSAGVVALAADSANNLNFGSSGASLSAAYLGATGVATYFGTLTPNGSTYRLGGSGTLTVAGPLTGARSLVVGTNAAGAVILSGANTYTGATTLNAGTLVVGSPTGLGTGGLTVNAGTVDLNGFSPTVASLAGASAGTVTDNAAGMGTSTFTVAPASGSATFSGTIKDGPSRQLSLVKAGGGTLVLNKANGNTYTGPTVIAGGTLDVRINNAQVLPAGSPVTFAGTGTLLLAQNGTASGSVSLGALTFAAGDGTVTSAKTNTGTTSNTLFASLAPRAAGATGNFALNTTNTTGGSATESTFRVSVNAAPVAGQSIDGGLYFAGGNFAAYDVNGYVRGLQYAGTPDPNATDVPLSADQPTLGPVTGRDVQLGGGTFAVTAQANDTVRSLKVAGGNTLSIAAGQALTISGGGLLKAGGTAATVAGPGTLAAGSGSGSGSELVVRTDAPADALTVSATVSAAGLTKTGPGVLTLAGPQSIAGPVYVNAGTLGGSFTAAGAVVVAAGATLAPGPSTGVVTIAGPLSLAGGTLAVDVNGAAAAGTDYDQVRVAAGTPTDVTLGAGTARLVVTAGGGYVPANGDRIWLIHNATAGATTGAFADAGGSPLPEGSVLALNGQPFVIHYGGNADTGALTGGNDVVLAAAPVPEPAAAGLLAAGAAGLLRRRRRAQSVASARR